MSDYLEQQEASLAITENDNHKKKHGLYCPNRVHNAHTSSWRQATESKVRINSRLTKLRQRIVEYPILSVEVITRRENAAHGEAGGVNQKGRRM